MITKAHDVRQKTKPSFGKRISLLITGTRYRVESILLSSSKEKKSDRREYCGLCEEPSLGESTFTPACVRQGIVPLEKGPSRTSDAIHMHAWGFRNCSSASTCGKLPQNIIIALFAGFANKSPSDPSIAFGSFLLFGACVRYWSLHFPPSHFVFGSIMMSL
jgi:hypothetical protein